MTDLSTPPSQPDPTQQARPEAVPLWPLEQIVADLRAERMKWRSAQQRRIEPGARELPSTDVLREIVAAFRGALFPLRLGPADLRPSSEDYYVGHTLDAALHRLLEQVRLALRYEHRTLGSPSPDVEQQAIAIVHDFAASLPRVRALLDSDVEAAFYGDPAAGSVDEVLLCYPGVVALIHHRLAHELYRRGARLLARIVAEIAHSQTGIDIHPGAQIGSAFFIDHGTGVVIGETAVIGNRVRLYQAVTLGAKRFPTDETGALQKGLPRHPHVEDDVVIYAGATILGNITIGKGSTIGGNVWLTRSVPAGSHVTQASSHQECPES